MYHECVRWEALKFLGKSSLQQRTLTPSVQGSNPCSPVDKRFHGCGRGTFFVVQSSLLMNVMACETILCTKFKKIFDKDNICQPSLIQCL